MKLKSNIPDSFWASVNKTPTCWEWTGTLQNGYGVFYGEYGLQRAHRYMFEVPSGVQVRRICGNRGCVNPEHLFLSNEADVPERPRRVGEAAANTRLTEEDVHFIRSMSRTGANAKALSKQLGVSTATIWSIMYNQTWKHLPWQNGNPYSARRSVELFRFPRRPLK